MSLSLLKSIQKLKESFRAVFVVNLNVKEKGVVHVDVVEHCLGFGRSCMLSVRHF